jgi:hypothetical protein
MEAEVYRMCSTEWGSYCIMESLHFLLMDMVKGTYSTQLFRDSGKAVSPSSRVSEFCPRSPGLVAAIERKERGYRRSYRRIQSPVQKVAYLFCSNSIGKHQLHGLI